MAISFAESVIGFLCGGIVGNQAKVSRSKCANLLSVDNFLASVDLPEPEFPKMIIFCKCSTLMTRIIMVRLYLNSLKKIRILMHQTKIFAVS